MHDSIPLCPYCGPWNGHPDGVEMVQESCERSVYFELEKAVKINTGYFYKCPSCGATSKICDTKQNAYLSAIRRFQPMQKPLTLEEALAVVSEEADESLPPMVYIESKLDFISSQYMEKYLFRLLSSTEMKCGVSWRPWRTRPTEEESAAAKWEDDDDKHE